MARGNADVLFKKNSKLESFLKRTLPEEAFERVRGYEACIIVTEKENKGFKYCVLDDEYIYQAENPPKNREDLQVMVPLKEIISVDLVIITKLGLISDGELSCFSCCLLSSSSSTLFLKGFHDKGLKTF